MNIFKKRKQNNDNIKEYQKVTEEGKTIIIKTMIDLDDDHKDIIFKIIENGLKSRTDLSNIPIAIMTATGIVGTMSLKESVSGDEVVLTF